MDLTVFVVDDNEVAREALMFLLRKDGLTCRAYASAVAFLEQLQPEHKGCIITDFRMPKMDGLTLVNRLREIGCQIPVIVITGHADVPLAIQAMKVGVQDFIEKPFKGDLILRAVHQCLELTRDARTERSRRAVIDHRLALLTEREKQVMAGIVKGLSNKMIGLDLGISQRTVDIHRANVMSKMQAGNLAELIQMVLAVDAA